MSDTPEPQALDDVDVFETRRVDFEDEWLWQTALHERHLRIQAIKKELVFWTWIAILFSISGGLFLARFVG